MFAKTLSTLSILVLSLSFQAYGHALIEPPIGVTGAGARSDVQRPSSSSPCGSVNIASVLAKSTAVKATNDAFTVTVQNFNGGQDGSTEIKSATVDTTATGKSFSKAVNITKNGVLAPTTVGSVQITGALPAGTKCTGGSDGASCLVSFTTEGGFGNCVLISQGTSTAKAAVADTTSTSAPKATSSSSSSSSCKTSTNAKPAKKGSRKVRSVGGTRAARALLARGDEAVDVARRSWIWI